MNESHGMELNEDQFEFKRENENGILFLAQFYYLKHLQGELTHSDVSKFQIIVENITAT